MLVFVVSQPSDFGKFHSSNELMSVRLLDILIHFVCISYHFAKHDKIQAININVDVNFPRSDHQINIPRNEYQQMTNRNISQYSNDYIEGGKLWKQRRSMNIGNKYQMNQFSI